MTANQIAMASVNLDKQKLEESTRHNKATEEELERSNRAQERINEFRAETEEFAARAEAEYKQRTADIQERYNNWYMEMQTANEQRKREIEGFLALLEQEKAAAERQYKERMGEVANREARVKELEAEERGRSNKANEALRSTELGLNWWATELENKRIEYQNSYWTGSLHNQAVQIQNQASYWTMSWSNERKRIENEYNLGLLGLQRDLARTQIEASRARTERALGIVDSIWRGVQAIKPNTNIRLW